MDSNPKVDKISISCEKFSIDLYKKAASIEKGNIVISPLAAYLLLSMTVHGAHGDTESQIKKVLHLSESQLHSLLEGFRILLTSLNSITEIDLSVVSQIFIDQKFELEINPEFQLTLENYFLNRSELIDFSKKAEAVKMINNWFEKATKNNINEIISEGDIEKFTTLLLLNAVYFKADWKFKFPSRDTEQEDFHIDENNKKSISMMKLRHNLVYGELDFINAKFAELPYKCSRDNFKMVVIVPNEINGLAKIEENLEHVNYEKLSECGKEEEDVEVKFPKIKFESTINFSACLKEMGIVDMFYEHKAKFAKIQSAIIMSMWVDKILQKALLEITEDGTKAAVVTFQSMLRKCCYRHPPPPPNKTLYADRPFLAIIMYEKLPLFYSRFTG